MSNQALRLTRAAILVSHDIKLLQRPRQVSLVVSWRSRMDLSDYMTEARRQLPREIDDLEDRKRRQIQAVALCNLFVQSATHEAAYGEGYGFFCRMRAAGESIPPEFEELKHRAAIKSEDRRVVPYVRGQLFIALIAEVEDFLGQPLKCVLRAYPQKLASRQIEVGDLLEAGSIELIIDRVAAEYIAKLFYASPLEYRDAVERLLSLNTSVLSELWPAFVETKARRDLGVHGGWKPNEVYLGKLAKVGLPPPSEPFLAPTEEYFRARRRSPCRKPHR